MWTSHIIYHLETYKRMIVNKANYVMVMGLELEHRRALALQAADLVSIP